MQQQDTIIALATPSGIGAIGVIRISGYNAIEIASKNFKSISAKKLNNQKSHTIHLGHIVSGNVVLDKVLVSIFKDPNSYTGENVVEISCHASPYIQNQIIQLFLRKGCRIAKAGEFTLRAFLNGKMDLSQAEAVADLITSDNEANHQIAMQQMRGGFSSEIKNLREELLNFASLIELELDFAEEDVEFAQRDRFMALLSEIQNTLKHLIDSFSLGNVLKNGIPIAIIGAPNVGKSTLLNSLLNEERAIVSDIAGTTRDTIEDEISIKGIGFRFIDTAGIRETKDVVESIGIERTFEKIASSRCILYLMDFTELKLNNENESELLKIKKRYPEIPIILIGNKIDSLTQTEIKKTKSKYSDALLISAKTGIGLDALKNRLLSLINTGRLENNETIVTNTRHYYSLQKALESIKKVKNGIEDDLTTDLLAIDLKEALFHMGEITGEVTNDELLGNIFSNFCIGK